MKNWERFRKNKVEEEDKIGFFFRFIKWKNNKCNWKIKQGGRVLTIEHHTLDTVTQSDNQRKSSMKSDHWWIYDKDFLNKF